MKVCNIDFTKKEGMGDKFWTRIEHVGNMSNLELIEEAGKRFFRMYYKAHPERFNFIFTDEPNTN